MEDKKGAWMLQFFQEKSKTVRPPRIGPRKASQSPSKAKAKIFGVEAGSAWTGNLPRGWTDKSKAKFWKSMTGDNQHKITQCHSKIDGHVSDPWGFCAALGRTQGYKPVRTKKQSEAQVSTAWPQLMRPMGKKKRS